MATLMTRKSPDLPIDIVISILSRLPSKSLLRFRLVCKSWCDLISDHKFIELHRSENINNGHVLIQHRPKEADESVYSLHCDKAYVKQTRLEFPLCSSWVLGCSNGLICLTGEVSMGAGFEIYLWNPIIRKLKVLPKSLVCDSDTRRRNYVFGFVPQINDYRVLKIVHGHHNAVRKVEIYSLRTNSWKLVENMVGHCLEYYIDIKRVMNGVVYFMARDWNASYGFGEFILSFDMANEVFGKIKIPQFPHSNSEDYEIPIMFREELFILSFYEKGEDMVDIWTKVKEHDAAESWTKKLTIDHWLMPKGFLKNGELVCRYWDQLYSYDPSFPEPIDLQFKDQEFVERPWRLDTFNYISESLILLNECN